MKETFDLFDELIKADIDYIHIATTNAWAKPRQRHRERKITYRINCRIY